MSTAPNSEAGLRHQLTAGQMTMVAVGGSISTGLFLGASSAISLAGPAVILTFGLAAFISWMVALALGELACAHPAAGSFGVYADLYLNEWASFVSRSGYWFATAFSVGAELVASATYMKFWYPHVPAWVWVAIFSAILLSTNLLSVHAYGRFEFWFASIKVAVIALFIVLGSALLLTGRAQPEYTTNGGFFPLGVAAPLLAITFAIYTFAGVEFVSITSGESTSPTEVARATRMTFRTLLALYLGAIVILVGIMPWNRAGTSESPFVTVFRSVSLPGATHFMNFVVLTAALSGANAALYISSRMLFSLARTGWAPRRLGHLSRTAAPTNALITSSYGIIAALLLERYAPGRAFEYILRAALFGVMLSWIISLLAHIQFRRRVTGEILARSPLGTVGSIIGLALVVSCVAKTWIDSRVNLISGLALLLALSVSYLVIKASRRLSR
ncbi:MAG TPA: amino acid permease [Terriglobales bacterium]|nr:amino acid permease [Terriglobales bacterium]